MAIEMAHSMPWYKYSKNVYGIDTFGISAPGAVVLKEFKYTVDDVLAYYKNI